MTCLYSLVIFDCDGVLVSTGPVEPRVRDALMREQGIVADLEAISRELFGMTNEQIWDVLTANYGMRVTPEVANRYISLCYEEFETSTVAIDGVIDVVTSLRSAGVPICVASNGPHEQMQITLRVTGHMPHFEGAIFSAYDVARPKPAPDLFLHAAKTMGFAPEDCVVIEDSRGGVLAGVEAGMRVLQFIGSGTDNLVAHENVTQFSSMSELPELLGLQ